MDIYNIDFGAENRWSIIDINVKGPWLTEFIRAAGIKGADQEANNRIVLFQSGDSLLSLDDLLRRLNSVTQKRWPSSGWREHSFPAYRCWQHTNNNDRIIEVLFENNNPSWIAMVISYLWHSIYFSMMESGKRGLPLHAGCIERNGKAFLLMGASGVGKSTACRRIVHPWRALCDDETFIFLNDAGAYHAYPFPGLVDFAIRKSSRSYDIQRGFPLAAIFFLKQGSVDRLQKVTISEAALRINQAAEDIFRRYFVHIHDVRLHRIKQLDNTIFIAKRAPCYELSVAKEGSFWLEMEKVL